MTAAGRKQNKAERLSKESPGIFVSFGYSKNETRHPKKKTVPLVFPQPSQLRASLNTSRNEMIKQAASPRLPQASVWRPGAGMWDG